jgi:hypothetical protein
MAARHWSDISCALGEDECMFTDSLWRNGVITCSGDGVLVDVASSAVRICADLSRTNSSSESRALSRSQVNSNPNRNSEAYLTSGLKGNSGSWSEVLRNNPTRSSWSISIFRTPSVNPAHLAHLPKHRQSLQEWLE